MNISGLSSQSLKDLHELVADALSADDGHNGDGKRYGVRNHPDWKKDADAFESEMKSRNMEFTPISW